MLLYWLWYALLPGLHEQDKVALLEHFQDPEDIFYAEEADLAEVEGLTEAGVKVLLNRDLTQAKEVLQKCTDKQIQILTYRDQAYPNRLKSISDPPLVLYYRGQLPDFDRLPLIGVVGTRKASAYGMTTAKQISFQIARCGGIIVSGGADGIDTMAFQGALMAGGSGIAVFGSGVDQIYPAKNRKLFDDLLRDGCILSEFPPETPPMRWNFPKRNRIISGLSCGVLVVEAPKRSGALITAEHAREQGRDVFVVTGNVGVDSCAGSNDLLRSGAIFAGCGWDVLSEYESQFPDKIHRDDTPADLAVRQDELEKPLEKVAQKKLFPRKNPDTKPQKEKKVIDNGANPPYSDMKDKSISLSAEEQKVLDLVTGDCLVDDVIAASGLMAGKVLATLTLLEVKGFVTRWPGRRVCRKG